MDKDRLKSILADNLGIQLVSVPKIIPIEDKFGNIYGERTIGYEVKAVLYWKEDGMVLCQDSISINV